MKRMPISLKDIRWIRMHQTPGWRHVCEHRLNLFRCLQNDWTLLGKCHILRHFFHDKFEIDSLVPGHFELLSLKPMIRRAVTSVGFRRLVLIGLSYLLIACQKVIQSNFFLGRRFGCLAFDGQIASWQPAEWGIVYTIVSVAKRLNAGRSPILFDNQIFLCFSSYRTPALSRQTLENRWSLRWGPQEFSFNLLQSLVKLLKLTRVDIWTLSSHNPQFTGLYL